MFSGVNELFDIGMSERCNSGSAGFSLQVSTLSEVTRHTPSVVVTDDESLDSLVVVDVVQTTTVAPGVFALLHLNSLLFASFLCDLILHT